MKKEEYLSELIKEMQTTLLYEKLIYDQKKILLNEHDIHLISHIGKLQLIIETMRTLNKLNIDLKLCKPIINTMILQMAFGFENIVGE